MKWAMDNLGGISGSGRHFIVALVEHLKGDVTVCWPGYRKLAKRVGCNERTIVELIEAHEIIGAKFGGPLKKVQRRRKAGGKERESNLYTMVPRYGADFSQVNDERNWVNYEHVVTKKDWKEALRAVRHANAAARVPRQSPPYFRRGSTLLPTRKHPTSTREGPCFLRRQRNHY